MFNEKENAFTPDERIRELVAGLPRVEPPADFGVRVRGRIAARRRPQQRGGLLVWAKLAVPVIALAALLAVFFGGSPRIDQPQIAQEPSFEASEIAVSEAADDDLPKAGPLENAPAQAAVTSVPTQAAPADPARDRRITRAVRQRSRRPAVSTSEVYGSGGSFEEAGRAVKRILPRGLESAGEKIAEEEVLPGPSPVLVADVLSVLGIDAERSASGWIVRSVREGSVAGKSGVQDGDIIEAIDGTDLTQLTELKGRFVGSSLKIKRGGKSLRLSILTK